MILIACLILSGVDPAARAEIWGLLLGVYPENATAAERQVLREARAAAYYAQKMAWLCLPAAQGPVARALVRTVAKDVVRTDRDLPEYVGDASVNPCLQMLLDILVTTACPLPVTRAPVTAVSWDTWTYTQGMSDLAAPMVLICVGDEALAYTYFEAQLCRLAGYFDDSGGMALALARLRDLIAVFYPSFYSHLARADMLDLFFAYRWLLLDFKREFVHTDALRLWETLWARHHTSHGALFLALAIIELYVAPLVNARPDLHGGALHEALASLSMKMDLAAVLRTARAVRFLCFSSRVSAYTRSTFPAKSSVKFNLNWVSLASPYPRLWSTCWTLYQ